MGNAVLVRTEDADMSDKEQKRRLAGMPTGPYNMADMTFSVHQHKPEKPQEEPSTVTESDLLDSMVICTRQPFQDLQEAVDRLFTVGILVSEVQK
jgi:hypothetical protein